MSGQKIHLNPLAPQIEDLDEVPFPAYPLVELKNYYKSIYSVIDGFLPDASEMFGREYFLKKIRNNGSIVPLIASRGCTNKCSFCYRLMMGFRQHNVPYVINPLKFLKEHYRIRGFEFADDLFNFNEEWVLEFYDSLGREGLDIF